MSWTPPIGIPNPNADFGYDIDVDRPAWTASWLTSPTTATANHYFVDKTDPAATDTANPYGHPDLPRITIPEGVFPPGTVVYIHAGTYSYLESEGGRFTWSGQGTTGSPVWFLGNPDEPPRIEAKVHFGEADNAYYCIVDSLLFGYSGLDIGRIECRPAAGATLVHHIIIRNCEIDGGAVQADEQALTIGSGGSGSLASYIVVYNCHIHHYGIKSGAGVKDSCGIYKDFNSSHVWAVDNHIHDIDADGIAGSHLADDTTQTSEYYYIGRNLIHENGENCIDLKGTRYVVISQNVCFGPMGREQGGAIVLHSGGVPATPVRDCWVIFNHIYHCTGGITSTSTNGARDISYIGNILHDCKAVYAGEADDLNGSAILITMNQGTNNFICDNTIYDCDYGIRISNLSSGNTVNISGNIVQARSDVNGFDLHVGVGEESFVSTDYNFWATGAKFRWNNGTRTLAYMQGTVGKETHSLDGDPLFINPPTDFSINTSSPAKDAGNKNTAAYAAFFALFGINIDVDYNNGARPATAGDWDMGALEFGSVAVDTTAPTPNPATIASVTVLSATAVTVVATTAIDLISPPVEYNHAIGGVYAGWQSSASRTFTGLSPLTLYSFRVKTRDAEGNVTTQSAASTATTNDVADILTLLQTANSSPVTELVRRGPSPDGPTADEVIHHSGDYPVQPETGYVYEPVGGKHSYVYSGTISLAAAVALR